MTGFKDCQRFICNSRCEVLKAVLL